MGNSAPKISAEGNPASGKVRGRSRRAQAVLVLIAFIFLCGYALARPLHDFVEYWSAAHLLVAHENPYSIADVSRIEHSLGFEETMPLMLLSPPWALALIAPLGLTHSYAWACFFWMLALIAAVALSSKLLMDVHFGDLRIPEVSDSPFYRSLFAFTFFPVLLCLRFAQTAPLILLGLAGFLYFESKGRPFFAGSLLSLTLIKPHLVLLVWLGVVLYSLRQRQWKIIAGAVVALSVLTGISLLFDHHAISHYVDLTRSPYLQAYAAGVAALIRKPLGGIGTLWIQLLPSLFGVVWFGLYWRRYGSHWSWSERLPMLLTVSVLTSSYGWAFDQTLLAVPVICLAAGAARQAGHIPFNSVILYTVLNGVLMITWPLPTVGLLPAPILLIVLLRRHARQADIYKPDPSVRVAEAGHS